MDILINNVWTRIKDGAKCKDITTEDDVAIVDGYQLAEEDLLAKYDSVIIVKKGEMVSESNLKKMLTARNTANVADKLALANVAICGLGGLGSNIAIMLARSGIGSMLIIDFDVVEPTNLNRQAYFISDLGKAKVDAIEEQIAEINPYCKVTKKRIKLDENNTTEILKDYNIVVEALDRAESKACLISTLLTDCKCTVVSGSGMAGYYSSNTIRTARKNHRLYVCGDEFNESKRGNGLMAARVGICAGHQANMVIRLILGELKV